MDSTKVNKIGTALSFCTVSGLIGVMIGGFMFEAVDNKYTKKNQVLGCARTEIIDTKTFVNNGQTITNTTVIPARIVADSLILNIKP